MQKIAISRDVKVFMEREIRSKLKRISVVLSSPERYPNVDQKKLREKTVMYNKFLEWLSNVPTKEGLEYARDVEGLKDEHSDLEKKLNDLQTRVEHLEVLVKKLVTYHQGDLS